MVAPNPHSQLWRWDVQKQLNDFDGTSGTFTGNINALGATFVSTDPGSGGGPVLTLRRDSASPAVSDTLGVLYFQGRDSTNVVTTYGQIYASILDPVNASEDGQLIFGTMSNGAVATRLWLNDTSTIIAGHTTGGSLVIGSGAGSGMNSFVNGADWDAAGSNWKALAAGYPVYYTQTLSNGNHNWYSDQVSRAAGAVTSPVSIMALSRTGQLTVSGAATIGGTLAAGNTTITGTLSTTGQVSAGTFTTSSTCTIFITAGYVQGAGGGSFMVQCPSASYHCYMTYHVPGAFACNTGIDSGGNLYIGGWSFGANAYTIWTSRHFANPACDYRIKENVELLPSMWEKVKALRPVSYTIKDFTLPVMKERAVKMRTDYLKTKEGEAAQKAGKLAEPGPHIEADDKERWGLIAHEVQEALLETAANGVKDDPDIIQTPTALPIIAALVKALQEAMTRIEALEAANGNPVR